MEEFKVGDKLFAIMERMHGPQLVTATVIEYDGKLKMVYFSDDCNEVVVREVMDGGRSKLKWFRNANDAINEKAEQVDSKWRSERSKYENLRQIPNLDGKEVK